MLRGVDLKYMLANAYHIYIEILIYIYQNINIYISKY